MFAFKYLKNKTLYYYVDNFLVVNPRNIKNCKVNVQLNLVNIKSYSSFLKSFFVVRFLSRLKVSKQTSKIILKKKQNNDYLSFFLSTKTLLVKRVWSSSSGFCTEFFLKNLSTISFFKDVFFNFSDLFNILVLLRVFSSLKSWFFNIFQSIDKK